MKTWIFALGLLMLSAVMVTGQNFRNNLIEKSSSTLCDECICIDSIMHDCVIPAYPGTIMVIYHNWGSGLKCDSCDTLTYYLMSDHSEIRTNRDGHKYEQFGWQNFPKLCDSVKETISKHPDAPVEIRVLSKNYNSATRRVDVDVEFKPYGQDLQGTFLANAVLIEENVLYEQSMDSLCGGFSGRRPCYHHSVARNMAHQFGAVIKEGQWTINDAVHLTFGFSLDLKWNPQQSFVVVYVYKQAPTLLSSEIQQAAIQSVTGSLAIPGPSTSQVEILNIFPNPVINFARANLRITLSGEISATITDMNGREIRQILRKSVEAGIYDIDFKTADLAPGIYFLRVTLKGQAYQKTFSVGR